MKDNINTLPMRPTTDDDYLHAAMAMLMEGGGFAQHIAKAYMHADLSNQARLKAAFPDLFTEFYIKHEMRNI